MRRATSSCSQGERAGARLSQRAAATGSMLGGRWEEDTGRGTTGAKGCGSKRASILTAMFRTRMQGLGRPLGEDPGEGPGMGRFARLLARLPAMPSRCEICRAWPSRPLCAACLARFAPAVARCRRCALPLPARRSGAGDGGPDTCGACLREPPPLDACHAAVDYGYPWDGLLARFKFHGEPGWARPLAALMRSAPGAAGALASADLLLPLPLSAARLRERGYNQALELARRLAPRRVDTRSLLRPRDAPPQASLPRQERLRNLAGAFALDPLRAPALRGQRLLLVDDVMTSGATLAAAARVLREAGAARVEALVLARTAPG
jgi:ComF family protein